MLWIAGAGLDHRARFNRPVHGLGDGGLVVGAALPAFEKNLQDLVRVGLADAENGLAAQRLAAQRLAAQRLAAQRLAALEVNRSGCHLYAQVSGLRALFEFLCFMWCGMEKAAWQKK